MRTAVGSEGREDEVVSVVRCLNMLYLTLNRSEYQQPQALMHAKACFRSRQVLCYSYSTSLIFKLKYCIAPLEKQLSRRN
jgi:hypothetical protein